MKNTEQIYISLNEIVIVFQFCRSTSSTSCRTANSSTSSPSWTPTSRATSPEPCRTGRRPLNLSVLGHVTDQTRGTDSAACVGGQHPPGTCTGTWASWDWGATETPLVPPGGWNLKLSFRLSCSAYKTGKSANDLLCKLIHLKEISQNVKENL